MEVLFKCFNQESWSHHGKHYDIPPPVPYRGYELREVTCVPRPKYLPVEMWQPIASGKTLELHRRARHQGDGHAERREIVDQIFHAYRDAAARAGRTLALGEDLCWGVGVYLADTQEEAIRRVEPAHDERYKWFAPFGFVRYADEQGRPWGTPGAPSRDADAARGRRAEGVAVRATVAGHRRDPRVRGALPGLDQLMIHWAEGIPPREFKEQLRWFATDVMPAFRR